MHQVKKSQRFTRVTICCFSLFYIVVKLKHLGFGLLVGQYKQLGDITMASGNM